MTSTCTQAIQKAVMGMNFCRWNLTVGLVLALSNQRLMLRRASRIASCNRPLTDFDHDSRFYLAIVT
jgi:hypothetical protein